MGVGGSAGGSRQNGGGYHSQLRTHLTGDPSRSLKHPVSVSSLKMSTGVPLGGPEAQEGPPGRLLHPRPLRRGEV